MKLTGHKTEAVYRRYAIVCEVDLTESLKKLAALEESRQACGTPTDFSHKTSDCVGKIWRRGRDLNSLRLSRLSDRI